MPKNEPVTSAQIASWLGITRQRVDQMIAAGTIPRGADLKTSVKAAYQHVARQAAGREGSAASQVARTKSLEASARLKTAQTKATEARLRRQSGELIETAALENIVTGFFGLFRSTMIALHPQLTRALHLPPAQDDIARDTIYAALNAIAAATDPLAGTNLRFSDET